MTPRLARAFWTVQPGCGEIREEALPPVEPGLVRVQSTFGLVSRGTETLVFGGHVPESEYRRMRCPFQSGDFPGPVKYGYSSVGRVIEGAEPLLGRDVFCLYPHQSEYVVPESAVLALPAGLPPQRAVLAANLETALNGLWDAAPRLGDRITIVGAGSVGCLCAFLAARIAGSDVELVDVLPERAGVAHVLGARFATPESAARERDLVIHASGTEAGLRTALSLCASDCSILELSWYGDKVIALPLGGDFHVRRLDLRGSQVGTLSPNARRRFSHRSRLELALALCRDPALDCLVSEEGALDALPATLVRLAQRESTVICHRIRYTR